MSAAEIIELIKKLPPEEKAEVVAYLQDEASGRGRVEEAAVDRKVKYAANEDFQKVLPEVFSKHEELFRRLAQ